MAELMPSCNIAGCACLRERALVILRTRRANHIPHLHPSHSRELHLSSAQLFPLRESLNRILRVIRSRPQTITVNMSLKRKASFSLATPSSPLAPAPSEWAMADNSKHLHCRTRKRFRDGRPNDDVVYGKELFGVLATALQGYWPSRWGPSRPTKVLTATRENAPLDLLGTAATAADARTDGHQ